MRQTRMAKGDFHISRRPSHADFNIAYSEVKVRMPNQLKTPSNKGKIKFDVSFHDGFRYESPIWRQPPCADRSYQDRVPALSTVLHDSLIIYETPRQGWLAEGFRFTSNASRIFVFRSLFVLYLLFVCGLMRTSLPLAIASISSGFAKRVL